MDERLLMQLLGSPQATAQAPIIDFESEEFRSLPTPAKLRTLQDLETRGGLDQTGKAMLQLLSRAAPVERPQAASKMPLPPQQQEQSFWQRLMGADPLAPVKRPGY